MNEGAPVWPLPLRLLHWTSAALTLGALGLGVWMVNAVQDPARRFDLTQTHKSIGVAVLALTSMRLCLRLMTPSPKPYPAPPWPRTARASHAGLYVLLVLLPLSGWLMASASPVRIPTAVFGFFTLPYPVPPNLPAYWFAHTLHAGAAIALAALTALHAAAALLHALWRRDGVLMRMLR